MSNSVLVITIDTPFGELVRECLEDTGQFSVLVTSEQAAANSFLNETDCSLIILDPGMDADETLAIGFNLLEMRPDLRFVLVAEPGQRSALEFFSPKGFLSKPLYLPELIEIIQNVFPEVKFRSNSQATTRLLPTDAPPWLADVDRAAQHLTSLTLASLAQAALITHKDQLWAYAGGLPQAAAHELANVVTRYWDRDESDLVRFVQLASTNAEHMLYATRLAPGMVLALVFDSETPFSTIRTQAGQLAHSLSISPTDDDEPRSELNPLVSFNSILSNVPPPNPAHREEPELEVTKPTPASQANRISMAQAESGATLEPTSRRRNFIRERVPALFSKETSPAVPLNRADAEANGQMLETQKHASSLQTEEELAVTVKASATRRNTDPVLQESEENRPRTSPEGGRKIMLDPVSPSVYDIDYACVLLPRFTHHHLTGDLSEQLGVWVQDTCLAFGWRLEYISVRPDYLQWIVNVPPATSPAYLMRILRKQTSERIFAEFPRLAKENPSGDFWAPGYLIMGGSQPPPAQLVKDYIVQTRQRQGYPLKINR